MKTLDKGLLSARNVARAALMKHFSDRVTEDAETKAFDLVRGVMDFDPGGWRSSWRSKMEKSKYDSESWETVLNENLNGISKAQADAIRNVVADAVKTSVIRDTISKGDAPFLQRAYARFGRHVFELLWNGKPLKFVRNEVARAKSRKELPPEKRGADIPPRKTNISGHKTRSFTFTDEVAAAIVTALDSAFEKMPSKSELANVVKFFPFALQLEAYNSKTAGRFEYELPEGIEAIREAASNAKRKLSTQEMEDALFEGELDPLDGRLGSSSRFSDTFSEQIGKLGIADRLMKSPKR
jgi:hypothetical protein